MSFETSYSLPNSDMSKLMSASLLPNRYSASVLASSVLPVPVGAQEDERAAGTARVLERTAAAADGLRHGGDRLVLAGR